MCVLSINLMVFDDSGGSFSLLVKPSGPCSSDEFGILRSRSDEIVNPINSATFFFVRPKTKGLDKNKRSRAPWVWLAGRAAQAVQKAESGLSKVFIFDRFYKVFRHGGMPCGL